MRRLLVVVVVVVVVLGTRGGPPVWRAEAAAFADRSALQTALFGCVGACGAALDQAGTGSSRCYAGRNGAWGSGTGAGCDAGSTHGAIDAWDVSRVTSMKYSECISISFV